MTYVNIRLLDGSGQLIWRSDMSLISIISPYPHLSYNFIQLSLAVVSPWVAGFYTHLSTIMFLQEWGDPRREEFYHYMKSYSPVDNVRTIKIFHFLSLNVNHLVSFYNHLKYVPVFCSTQKIIVAFFSFSTSETYHKILCLEL